MRKITFYTLIYIAIGFWAGTSCKPSNPNFDEDIDQAKYFHKTVKNLSDVIVYDIFSPPVASRIYA